MSNVSVEMNRLTDSVKEDPDKIAVYIKTAPEKRCVLSYAFTPLSTIFQLYHGVSYPSHWSMFSDIKS